MRKALNLEDEKIIPAEENNCCGCDPKTGKCTILTTSKLSETDRLNCGTLRCPFYKPNGHANSVKHVDREGNVSFETREEYEKANGKSYLPVEDMKLYENYPHAAPDAVDRLYRDHLRSHCDKAEVQMVLSTIPYLTKGEIIKKGAEYGIDIHSGLKRTEMAEALERGLCEL